MITVSYGMVLGISDAVERDGERRERGGGGREREKEGKRERFITRHLDDPIPY